MSSERADVAQVVEHVIGNDEVRSANLRVGSIMLGNKLFSVCWQPPLPLRASGPGTAKSLLLRLK